MKKLTRNQHQLIAAAEPAERGPVVDTLLSLEEERMRTELMETVEGLRPYKVVSAVTEGKVRKLLS